METKTVITPNEYKRIKAQYEEALRRRAEQMKLDSQNMSQVDVAKRWHVHAAIVIRALSTYQPE